MVHVKQRKMDLEATFLKVEEVYERQRYCSSYYTLVIMLGVVAVVCAIDRSAMSIAILPMSAELGWGDKIKGAVNSAFNAGYMFTNLYGGTLAATLSPKRALIWGVVVWSLFTLLTPVAAASGSLQLLLLVRATMGLGEGVFFPAVQCLVKGWVPQDRRSRALSLVYSGHQVGSILSLLLSPAIITTAGWEWVFYTYAGFGFLWVLIFMPQGAPGGAEEGYSFIAARPVSVSGTAAGLGLGMGALPAKLEVLKLFLSNKVFWALMLAHSTFGIGYNLCIAWLPTYYSQQFAVDIKQSAWLSILPWLVMALTTNLSGWAADHLINRGLMPVTRTRKLLQTLGTAGPALCLGYLALTSAASAPAAAAAAASGANAASEALASSAAAVPPLPGQGHLLSAMLLLTGMMGFQGLQAGGFAATHQDISTKYAGVLFGITNAAASFMSSISLYLTGVVLERTESWPLVFNWVACLNLLCCVVFLMFASSEPQFE